MAMLREGDETDLHRVRVGPLRWVELSAVLEELGWVWSDGVPGRRKVGGLPATFHHGWLEVGRLPGLRLQRLAAFLARRTSRAVVVRSEDAHAEVGPSGVEMSLETDWLVLRPDGGREHLPTSMKSGLYLDAENGIDDEALRAWAGEEWDGVAVPEAAGVALAEEGEARVGTLTVTDADPPVDVGPRWVLTRDGHVYTVEPAERAVAEEILDVSGRLDTESRRPDLSRWEIRAARRLGLDAPPSAGDPQFAAWLETCRSLSYEDRSAGGRRGMIPAWKLRTQGSWALRAEECALIAATPGVPAGLAAFLATPGACDLEVQA